MTRARLGVLLIALLAGLPGCIRAPEPEPPAPAPEAFAPACPNPPPAIDRAIGPALAEALRGLPTSIEGERQAGGLAGVAVGVVQGQTLVFAAGFGCANLERRSPMTPDTVYRIGSLTQVFEATAMMQLRDAGHFRLDDALERSVPDVWYRDAAGARVSPTWRELAAHTSGLPRPVPLGLETVSHLFRYVQSRTAASKPGTRYAFSDLGYVVLGQSLAKVARLSYHDLMHQHLFRPLAMESTGFEAGSVDPARLAVGYKRLELEDDGWRGRDASTRVAFPPSGTILSSISDLSRFLMLQFRGDASAGKPVLAAASVREMWQPVAATNVEGRSAGLGWFVRPYGRYTLVSKDGELPGYTTRVQMVPELELGVVAFVNETPRVQRHRGHGVERIARQVLAALLPALQPAAEAAH